MSVMAGLADRIRFALANLRSDNRVIDPMRELANVLREVVLEPGSGGGAEPPVDGDQRFLMVVTVVLLFGSLALAQPLPRQGRACARGGGGTRNRGRVREGRAGEIRRFGDRRCRTLPMTHRHRGVRHRPMRVG